MVPPARPGPLDQRSLSAPYPALVLFVARIPTSFITRRSISASPTTKTGKTRDRARFEAWSKSSATPRRCSASLRFSSPSHGWRGPAVDHRRWLRASKIQTDAQAELIDFVDVERGFPELHAIAGGEALSHRFARRSRRRRRAAAAVVGAPVNRILWSVQAGIVLASVRPRTTDCEAQRHRRVRRSAEAWSAVLAISLGASASSLRVPPTGLS